MTCNIYLRCVSAKTRNHKTNTIMKRLILIIALSNLFLINSLLAQEANVVIGDLLNANKPFELKEAYEEHKNQLSPMLDYLTQAVIANSFNQPEEGIKALDILLGSADYQAQLGFANVSNLVYMQSRFYADLFEYKKSAAILGSFLENASTYMDIASVSNFKSALENYEVLASSGKVELLKLNQYCEVSCKLQFNELLAEKLKKQTAGLSLLVDCSINGLDAEMIFDSGNPSFTLISEEFAKQYGIKSIGGDINVGGVGEETRNARLGVADTLKLGSVICINPVFYIVEHVLPPEIISDTLPQIHAVLGSNILFRLGEYHYFPKENKIVFPQQETTDPDFSPNMLMKDGRHQYIQIQSGVQQMLMHFDLGSSNTDLSQKYFTLNKQLVNESGVRDSLASGGLGGMVKQEVYKIPSFEFELADTPFCIQDVPVNTQAVSLIDNEYGILGLDFFSDCKKVIVNYNKMFVAVEK